MEKLPYESGELKAESMTESVAQVMEKLPHESGEQKSGSKTAA